MKHLLLSIIIVSLVGILMIPNAFAVVEVIVQNAPGSSVSGCEKTDSCFIPSTVTINVGDTVVWTNPDTMSHIVAGHHPFAFDSGLIMAGNVWKHKFITSGIHDYYCKAHPWMEGKVIVKSGSYDPEAIGPLEPYDRSPPPTTLESPSTTSDLDSEAKLGNIRLQEKLDEYWNCANMLDSTLTPDCITASLPTYYNELKDLGYIFGVESLTDISVYGVDCDPVCQLQINALLDPVGGKNYTHFPVDEKLEKFQNVKQHQQIFDTYASITPKQILDQVSIFFISTDDYGQGGEDASILKLNYQLCEYFGIKNCDISKFYVSIDPLDMVFDGVVDEQYLKPTLIHENAHILSLSANQGDNNGLPPEAYDRPSLLKQLMTEGERSCANYYNDLAGCMDKDSYLNAFFQKFWAGIYHDHNWEFEYDVDDDGFSKQNEMFYKRYSTQFVTEYAASNPDEDFAESFMAFILKEYPEQKLSPRTVTQLVCMERVVDAYCMGQYGGGPYKCEKVVDSCQKETKILAPGQDRRLPFSIADQKIIFFYDYPELVEMRDFIRSAIATSEFCDNGSVWKDGKCQQTGGCLIATAAFGSEMAPQVQFLREIRDNTVLQTESGSAFMTGFNQFYYSFSPAIADYERENPAFKEAVKLTLTPLLASLTLLQYADIDSESEMLGYGIGIILLNIGMYFIAPAILIMKVRKIF